ncbi:MAG: FtsX-like permease family protein, partial [Gammaproteobacteria bacterium]
MLSTLALSWRFLYRDWKAGELNLLLLAMLICVSSITTVAFTTNRMGKAIDRQSSELLAADFVIASSQPIRAQRLTLAKKLGLRTARIEMFRSVLVAGDAVQLVAVKVVDNAYPLRGELKLSAKPYGKPAVQKGKPASGTIWVTPRLLQAMNLHVGDTVQLGDSHLVISKVIAYEPDRGGDFFRMAPRVMLGNEDLAATKLVKTGSRINYRLLVAGKPKQVAQFVKAVKRSKHEGEELISVKQGRPDIQFAFERADFFLNIIALISVLLGSIATAMAAQRYSRRHVDSVAILRTLGLSQWRIFSLVMLEMCWFALLASLAGCLLAYLAQYGLSRMMASLIVGQLPQPGFTPVWIGTITGFIALFGFVMPTLWLLKKVPPIRVLRRDQATPLFSLIFILVFILALFVLWLWRLGQGEVTQYLLLGSLGTLLALFILSRLLVVALKPMRGLLSASWRYGLANLTRRGNLTAIQVSAFGLGLMFIILNVLIRTEMLQGWRNTLPENAPNYFLINAQQKQLPALRQFFSRHHVASPAFAPMARARLLRINGKTVRADDYASPRAKRLVLHEFNLSWRAKLQKGNKLLAGRWWRKDEAANPYISLEQSIIKAFHLRLGDKLTFDLGGDILTLTLLNSRHVDWNSFRVNFFAVTPPGLLEKVPTNWVASMPTAVEYLLGFTLVIGVIIMLTALKTTEDERRQEAALLHTLGARRSWILRGNLAEFSLMGMLATQLVGTFSSRPGGVTAKKLTLKEFQSTCR